jgi:hypothetical protein
MPVGAARGYVRKLPRLIRPTDVGVAVVSDVKGVRSAPDGQLAESRTAAACYSNAPRAALHGQAARPWLTNNHGRQRTDGRTEMPAPARQGKAFAGPRLADGCPHACNATSPAGRRGADRVPWDCRQPRAPAYRHAGAAYVLFSVAFVHGRCLLSLPRTARSCLAAVRPRRAGGRWCGPARERRAIHTVLLASWRFAYLKCDPSGAASDDASCARLVKPRCSRNAPSEPSMRITERSSEQAQNSAARGLSASLAARSTAGVVL